MNKHKQTETTSNRYEEIVNGVLPAHPRAATTTGVTKKRANGALFAVLIG
jgi:hypothetical protein